MIIGTAMAVDWKKLVRTVSLFLVARYPFVNGLTFLLLLGERAKRESYPFMEPNLVYGHVIVFILCGVCMGFNFRRKETALITTGQLLYLAFNIYVNEKLNYRRWVTNRIASRLVGVAGIMMLYAYFTMPKPRQAQLRRLGETLVGLWLICATYMLVESAEDRSAFTSHIPGGTGALYLWVVVLGTCALCFLPGMFVYDVTQILVVVLSISTVMVDCDVNYWTKRRGLDFWNQIRLTADLFCIILGLCMYLTCFKSRERKTE